MAKQKLVFCDSSEIVDLIEAALEKFDLDAEETSVSELISELKGQEE